MRSGDDLVDFNGTLGAYGSFMQDDDDTEAAFIPLEIDHNNNIIDFNDPVMMVNQQAQPNNLNDNNNDFVTLDKNHQFDQYQHGVAATNLTDDVLGFLTGGKNQQQQQQQQLQFDPFGNSNQQQMQDFFHAGLDDDDDMFGVGDGSALFALTKNKEQAANISTRYQDICMGHIQNYIHLSRSFEPHRESDRLLYHWETKMGKVLNQETSSRPFNAADYGGNVIAKIGGEVNQEKNLNTLFLGESPNEVCRLFLASLFLANQSNVEFTQPEEKDWETFDGYDVRVKVLKTNVIRDEFEELADLENTSNSRAAAVADAVKVNTRGARQVGRGGGAAGGGDDRKESAGLQPEGDEVGEHEVGEQVVAKQNADANNKKLPTNKKPLAKKGKSRRAGSSEDEGFVTSSSGSSDSSRSDRSSDSDSSSNSSDSSSDSSDSEDDHKNKKAGNKKAPPPRSAQKRRRENDSD